MGNKYSRFFSKKPLLWLKNDNPAFGINIAKIIENGVIELQPHATDKGYKKVWMALRMCERCEPNAKNEFTVSTKAVFCGKEYSGNLTGLNQNISLLKTSEKITGTFFIRGKLSVIADILEKNKLITDEAAKKIKDFYHQQPQRENENANEEDALLSSQTVIH